MHLISTLCAGVAGAANGWAELYVRGTSTRATWYSDFEASTSNSSGANITLDAYGAVEVYVNQLVDVIVKSSDGTTVRSFTDGYASPNVEVISPSFTGTDYVSAASAVNEPTTLQSVLNLWVTNAGSPDWKVNIGGTATTLLSAFGNLTGLVYNVKNPTYGAVGDGVTNDQAAIQAALTAAANAGGGIVFFPKGTYLVSTAIEWDHSVSAVGVGCGGSVIKTGSASNARIITLTSGTASDTPHVFYGLSFDASQSNTGEQFYSTVAVNVKFVGCEFGVSSNCAGNLVRNFSNGGSMTFEDCRFTAYSGYCAYTASDVVFEACRFFAGTTTYNQELVRVDSETGLLPSYISFYGCYFDASTVSNAPSDLHGMRVVSSIAYTSVSDSHFISTGQLFTSAIRFLGGGLVKANGCHFSGCSTKYTGASGATTPLGAGSYLDIVDRRRFLNSFTVSDGYEFQEISSTGTAPTITLPAMLYPGQKLFLHIYNNSGGNWAAVTFTGSYNSLITGATAVNNGQTIFITAIVADTLSSGTYLWNIVGVQVG